MTCASGCRPSPNSATICRSWTRPPASKTRQFEDGAVADGQRCDAAAQPDSGGLALLLVVAPEARVAAVRVVAGGDLAGQVRVAAAGRELVQTHHAHTVQQGYATPSRERCRNAPGVWHLGCGESRCEVGEGEGGGLVAGVRFDW